MSRRCAVRTAGERAVGQEIYGRMSRRVCYSLCIGSFKSAHGRQKCNAMKFTSWPGKNRHTISMF